MKADTNLILLVIFSMLIGMVVLTLVVPKIAEPVSKVYDSHQAYMQAKIVAADINALSYADSGEVIRNFDLKWDITISCKKEGNLPEKCELVVSGQKVTSKDTGSVYVLGKVKGTSIPGANSIKMSNDGSGYVNVIKVL